MSRLIIRHAVLALALMATAAHGQVDEPSCVSGFDENLASIEWTENVWREQFGRPHPARATTQVPEQERMKFRFYHFGRADGPPMIMLMGHGQSMLSWDPLLLARYAACFDVYLIDHLGIGRSAFRGRPARVTGALEQMDFVQMGDWVFQATEGIRRSPHCKRAANHCTIVGTAPHLLGWAMGGKVAGVAAERHPGAFGDILNLGGNIARHDEITDAYPLGPNPDAAHLVESDDITLAAVTAYTIKPEIWGATLANSAISSLIATGQRTLPHYNATPQGLALTQQKVEQARAAAASVNELEAVANRVLIAYGEQDDYNFCYTGDLVPTACARADRQGYECSASGRDGCLWGLAPLSDYFGTPNSAFERLSAGICEEACLRPFTGAHGFPGQSQRAVLIDVVRFVAGETDGWTCSAE